MPTIEINVMLAKFGFATGKPNHFCRPELRNSKPAIIRRMLRTCGWNLPRLVSIVGVPPSIVARRPRAAGRIAPFHRIYFPGRESLVCSPPHLLEHPKSHQLTKTPKWSEYAFWAARGELRGCLLYPRK